MDALTDRLACSFVHLGIQPGDRIAFLAANCPELVFLYLASFKCGAIAVPLNVRLTSPELRYLLEHSQARILVSQADLYPLVEPIRSELPCLVHAAILGERTFASTVPFSNWIAERGTPPVWPATDPAKPTAILYTSGTTAKPKGVTHTHHSLEHAVRFYREATGLHSKDVLCGMLPMAHIFGFTLQMLAPLSTGATVIVVPRFEPAWVLEVLKKYRVTHLYGLPVMFNALVNHPEASSVALDALRYCLAGGDAVPKALNDRMQAVFHVEIHEGCGMTEVIPYTLNRLGFENRIGSIGKASIGMTLRLVDEVGNDVPPGSVGEVLVKSEAVMAGYWNDPGATAETLRDGWLYTGDLARVDAEGYYWFVGRRKEIIVRGGSNISPLEVEASLYLHPAVREVAVIGSADANLGEIVVAFVSLKPETNTTEAELKRFASSHLAAYKIPERIHFLAELPKGLTGKIQRKALKSMATEKG